MHTKGVCVCVKRFCGPVYVLVDLSYISQHNGDDIEDPVLWEITGMILTWDRLIGCLLSSCKRFIEDCYDSFKSDSQDLWGGVLWNTVQS